MEVYGFGVDYPSDCVIELNPKSTRAAGDLAFKSPRGYRLFLSWGELRKVEKLGGVEKHADYSIERMKGRGEAEVEDVRRERLTVMGHLGSYNEVKVKEGRRGLLGRGQGARHQVRSLHVHCEASSRYFVLYGTMVSEAGAENEAAIYKFTHSFSCHR